MLVAPVVPLDQEKVYPVPVAEAVNTVEAPSQKVRFPVI